MSITLSQIFTLVGKLDDSAGDDTSRERFRQFLKDNVKEVGQVRDYIEECLRTSGDQYNRALQDLINYLGQFLEFDVTFGRYHGVPGQIGFDGLWRSPTGFHIVVEVKTTETYPIKTATLLGYVDEMISGKMIPDWDNALGLYVVGRPDPEIRQLENAIIAEKRTHQLRLMSVESLLSLAEMMNEYDVSHEDILAILCPSGPSADNVVGLMTRLVAQQKIEESIEESIPPSEIQPEGEIAYWLTPVKSDEEYTAEEVIEKYVGGEKIYACGERTPGRKHMKPGDYICFYATGNGVVAHARLVSSPERKIDNRIRKAEMYPWRFRLDNDELYLKHPIVIDAELRTRLDAFRGRDPNKSWAWFVQATRKLTANDFKVLVSAGG